MSQLQIGLITLGALIILAVLLFNWWQERSIRQEMSSRFNGPIDDVLMDEPRVTPSNEPVEDFHIDPDAVLEFREEVTIVEETIATPLAEEAVPEEVIEDEAAPEATIAPEVVAATEEEAMLEEEFPPEPTYPDTTEPPTELPRGLPTSIDPQIDEIAIITFNLSCSGAAIRDALQPLPAFQKPMRWLGEDADGNVLLLTKENEQAMFKRVYAALQLEDRSGPASGEDLRNFHAKVEDLVARLGGAIEWREHGDPLQYARELDQYCIDVDVMISLQLLAGSGGPFAGTKLRGVVEAGGGELKDDGQFHFADENGQTLFILGSLDRKPLDAETLRTAMLRGVLLQMDLPRIVHGAEAFNQMILVGRKLETALSSKLMDENQRLLGDPEIDKIRQQLKVLYSRMFARGIVPGSPSALRLFS
jgi:FtsZ-interacting cell division protein ZipA